MNGEMQMCFLLISLWIAAAVFFYRMHCRHREDPKQEVDFFDSLRLQREVQELAERMNELEALDSMIIDLRLCKPEEVLRAFRMEWQGADGIDHKFDFMADGQSATSAQLLVLAERQRAEINVEIAQRIFDLYARASRLSFFDEEPEEQ